MARRKNKAGVGRSASKGVRAAGKRGIVAGRVKQAPASGKGGVKNLDEYIAAAPEPARSRLKEMRAAIRSAAPAEAVEIISYKIPAFKAKKCWCGTRGF